jgi:hypothetical protein
MVRSGSYVLEWEHGSKKGDLSWRLKGVLQRIQERCSECYSKSERSFG